MLSPQIVLHPPSKLLCMAHLHLRLRLDFASRCVDFNRAPETQTMSYTITWPNLAWEVSHRNPTISVTDLKPYARAVSRCGWLWLCVLHDTDGRLDPPVGFRMTTLCRTLRHHRWTAGKATISTNQQPVAVPILPALAGSRNLHQTENAQRESVARSIRVT